MYKESAPKAHKHHKGPGATKAGSAASGAAATASGEDGVAPVAAPAALPLVQGSDNSGGCASFIVPETWARTPCAAILYFPVCMRTHCTEKGVQLASTSPVSSRAPCLPPASWESGQPSRDLESLPQCSHPFLSVQHVNWTYSSNSADSDVCGA